MELLNSLAVYNYSRGDGMGLWHGAGRVSEEAYLKTYFR